MSAPQFCLGDNSTWRSDMDKRTLRHRYFPNPHKDTGSAVVEFAVVLPMLLLILFGIVEFSIALYDKAIITNASREAVRAGVVYKSPQLTVAEITAVANSYCLNNLITFGASTAPSISVDQSGGTASGNPLTVKVTYSYSGLVLGLGIAPITGALSLSSATTMKYE